MQVPASVDPNVSLTGLLALAGLGKYAAGIVSLIIAAKAAASDIMPWLDVPTASSGKAYKITYGLLARFTGNYGNNAPVALASIEDANTAPLHDKISASMKVALPPAGGIVPTPPALK